MTPAQKAAFALANDFLDPNNWASEHVKNLARCYLDLMKPVEGLAEIEQMDIAEQRHIKNGDRLNISQEYVDLLLRNRAELLRLVRQQQVELAQALERVSELEKLVYVPGQWRCAKCKCVVIKAVISAASGDVGMKADAKTEACPNGCGPLWPVTERQAGNELCDRLDAAEARVKILEAALEWISDAHVPDQPAASSTDENVWARQWVGTIRGKAKTSLKESSQ